MRLHLGKLPSRDPSGALVRRSRSIAVGCAALGGPWVGRSAASRRHTHGSVGRSVDMLQSRNTADFYFRCACTYLRYDCMNTFWPKIGAAMDVPPADSRQIAARARITARARARRRRAARQFEGRSVGRSIHAHRRPQVGRSVGTSAHCAPLGSRLGNFPRCSAGIAARRAVVQSRFLAVLCACAAKGKTGKEKPR